MNEYERILRRAVAELGESDESARYAVYERARTAVLRQLRAFDPPKTDEEIDQHLEALDAAVEHIESEYALATARPPVRPRVVVEQGARFRCAAAGPANESWRSPASSPAVLVAAAGAYVFATFACTQASRCKFEAPRRARPRRRLRRPRSCQPRARQPRRRTRRPHQRWPPVREVPPRRAIRSAHHSFFGGSACSIARPTRSARSSSRAASTSFMSCSPIRWRSAMPSVLGPAAKMSPASST